MAAKAGTRLPAPPTVQEIPRTFREREPLAATPIELDFGVSLTRDARWRVREWSNESLGSEFTSRRLTFTTDEDAFEFEFVPNVNGCEELEGEVDRTAPYPPAFGTARRQRIYHDRWAACAMAGGSGLEVYITPRYGRLDPDTHNEVVGGITAIHAAFAAAN